MSMVCLGWIGKVRTLPYGYSIYRSMINAHGDNNQHPIRSLEERKIVLTTSKEAIRTLMNIISKLVDWFVP